MFSSLIALFAFIKGPLKFLTKEATTWLAHREETQQATQDAKVAEITAKAELAAYKIQSDLNWDLAWAGQASGTWKDEYLVLLWFLPMWPMVIAFPVDMFFGTHYFAQSSMLIKQVPPDVLQWWMIGGGMIFAAVFGNKAAGTVMMGTTVSKVAESFKDLPDEVPDAAVEAVTERIKAKMIRIKPPIPTVNKT
jgi:hypothetical protein